MAKSDTWIWIAAAAGAWYFYDQYKKNQPVTPAVAQPTAMPDLQTAPQQNVLPAATANQLPPTVITPVVVQPSISTSSQPVVTKPPITQPAVLNTASNQVAYVPIDNTPNTTAITPVIVPTTVNTLPPQTNDAAYLMYLHKDYPGAIMGDCI